MIRYAMEGRIESHEANGISSTVAPATTRKKTAFIWYHASLLIWLQEREEGRALFSYDEIWAYAKQSDDYSSTTVLIDLRKGIVLTDL